MSFDDNRFGISSKNILDNKRTKKQPTRFPLPDPEVIKEAEKFQKILEKEVQEFQEINQKNIISSDEENESEEGSAFNKPINQSDIDNSLYQEDTQNSNREGLNIEESIKIEIEENQKNSEEKTILDNLENSKNNSAKEDNKANITNSETIQEFLNKQDNQDNNTDFGESNIQIDSELNMDIKAEAFKYASARTDDERSAISDKISENDITEFLTQVIRCDATPSEIKRKIKKQLEAILAGDKQKENWTGFDKNVPIFSGESNKIDIIAWIFAIDTYISAKSKIYNITNEIVAYDILSRLQGSLYNHYKRYMEDCKRNNKIPSWEDIKKLLLSIFSTPSKQLDLRRKLSELKATKFREIYQYNDEFMKISSMIDDILEMDLIHMYLRGLDDKIASKIYMNNPNNLASVVSQAITFYSIFGKNQVANTNYAKAINKPNFNRLKNNYNNNYQRSNLNSYQNFSNRNYAKPSAPSAPPSYNQLNKNFSRNNKNNQSNSNKVCYNCNNYELNVLIRNVLISFLNIMKHKNLRKKAALLLILNNAIPL